MVNLLYSWSFNSKKHRWIMWYSIVLSVAIWLIIWWFLSKQYWMSFVLIILIWLVFYVENNSEDIIPVNITDTWIKIENNFYPFSNITNYTIIYENENAILLRIYLDRKIWVQYIDIQIDNSIVNDLKNILSNFLEENNKWELSFGEKLIRILKI